MMVKWKRHIPSFNPLLEMYNYYTLGEPFLKLNFTIGFSIRITHVLSFVQPERERDRNLLCQEKPQ